uniref:Rad21_Rec8 domain-containing protein n=1 Tax=Mesocestoides corti TaxID=53468 RepID=A0A5K3F8D1_MESCO
MLRSCLLLTLDPKLTATSAFPGWRLSQSCSLPRAVQHLPSCLGTMLSASFFTLFRHRLPVSTEETLAFAEPQAPVQAAEPQEGPSSPKRRALQSVEDASKLSMPEPQLLELDQPQPCAASSAVKARPPRRAAPSPLPPLSLEELVHPPQAPPPRRPRKRPARLLVDSVLQLSKAQLRENFELSKSLLCTRAEILALSSWETHPKRARSLNVDRLLALPANWELAISLGLGELWRSKRRMCEALPLRDSPQPPRDTSRSQSRSNLSSLRESALEASREEARAASDMLSASSFVPRQSSLNPSSFTIRASSSQDGDKSLQQQPPTPKDTVIAQQTTYSIADGEFEPLPVSVLVQESKLISPCVCLPCSSSSASKGGTAASCSRSSSRRHRPASSSAERHSCFIRQRIGFLGHRYGTVQSGRSRNRFHQALVAVVYPKAGRENLPPPLVPAEESEGSCFASCAV